MLQSLPALRSFCLYCAVGIIAVYFFQATFFVAALSLDLRRIESGRNGICFCYKHKHYQMTRRDDDPISQRIFKAVGELITHPVAKVVLGLVTAAFLGVAIWGTVELEVRFESVWFLPPESYVRKWFDAREAYFPSDGETVTVFMTGLEYNEELDKVAKLIDKFENSTDIIKSVNSWMPDIKEYVNDHIGIGDDGKV